MTAFHKDSICFLSGIQPIGQKMYLKYKNLYLPHCLPHCVSNSDPARILNQYPMQSRQGDRCLQTGSVAVLKLYKKNS